MRGERASYHKARYRLRNSDGASAVTLFIMCLRFVDFFTIFMLSNPTPISIPSCRTKTWGGGQTSLCKEKRKENDERKVPLKIPQRMIATFCFPYNAAAKVSLHRSKPMNCRKGITPQLSRQVEILVLSVCALSPCRLLRSWSARQHCIVCRIRRLLGALKPPD